MYEIHYYGIMKLLDVECKIEATSTTACNVCHSFVYRYCQNFTMDVIAITAFGLQMDTQSDPDSTFVKMAKKIFNIKPFSAMAIAICKEFYMHIICLMTPYPPPPHFGD